MIHDDPEYWRKRAEKARALAEKMTDSQGKAAMIEIAEKYNQLAKRAEKYSQPAKRSLKRMTGSR